MKVIIDERERELYEKCSSIVNAGGTYINLSKRVLPLGDIHITTDEDKDVLLIERKSLADLLASIKDGRYEEQSYRLIHSSGYPPHSIIYIIEGQMSNLRTPMEKKIVYSALTSLNFFKGFSVIRTNSVSETADYLIWMSEKIERNFLKCIFPYYLQPQYCKYMKIAEENKCSVLDAIMDINDAPQPKLENVMQMKSVLGEEENSQPTPAPTFHSLPTNEMAQPPEIDIPAPNYCTVVKKVKKDNVTPENIGEIILCQIPGISAVTAIAIMKKFGAFPQLIKELQTNINCLDDIVCETKGKTRKIGKNCIENIKKYLV
jgi:ERCC4-type nuclease